MLALALALASAGASGDYPLVLVECNATAPEQRWAQGALPTNLPANTTGAGAFQLDLTHAYGCSPPSSGSADACCANVARWGTSVGDVVWVTHCAAQEHEQNEENRVWALTSPGKQLRNPVSGLCMDAPKGTDASPGDRVVLVKCGGANASSWVFRTADASLSQVSRAGGYPGLCVGVAPNAGPPPGPPPPPPPPFPSTVDAQLTVDLSRVHAKTSATLASFNFDWHKDDEEAPVWINMSAQVINLESPMLLQAARALAPAVLRIGGSEGDVMCYDVPEFESTCADMGQNDTTMCLQMPRYEALASFANSTGLRLVFGLNTIWGRDGHSVSKPLNLTNIGALLAYTAAHNVPVWGFELGNEKPMIPAAVSAKDYHNLHALLVKLWPDAATRPKLIGNDVNTNPGYLTEWLPLVADVLDVTTYHHYDGYGLDPHIADKIMTPSFLDSTVSAQLNGVHAKYAPNTELWVGEAAAAWHSGAAGVTNRFTSSFWWSDALGALAAANHSTYCRQTLLGGNYGLLNRTTYEPNPDFYISLAVHELVGDVVLTPPTGNFTGVGWLRPYISCTRGQTGAVTLLLINIAPATTFDVTLAGVASVSPRDEYVFTAESLASRTVSLNGNALAVEGGRLPTLAPRRVTSGGSIAVAPHSIGFFVLPDANAAACA